MKNNKSKEQIYDEGDYFVRIYRNIISDYLDDKRLTLNEFEMLIWLHLRANPYSGLFNTSYDALRMEQSGKHTKNEINKICLNLKEKKYIYFKNQQGRRSSFNIHIANYPLVSGVFKKIPEFKEGVTRSENGIEFDVIAEDTTDVAFISQKSKRNKVVENSNDIEATEIVTCRSPNNDNKNKIDKDNLSKAKNSTRYRLPIEQFQPTNDEESLCRDIANCLGELTMQNIIFARGKYGIELIEKADNICAPIFAGENGIENPIAFFYAKLKELKMNNST